MACPHESHESHERVMVAVVLMAKNAMPSWNFKSSEVCSNRDGMVQDEVGFEGRGEE